MSCLRKDCEFKDAGDNRYTTYLLSEISIPTVPSVTSTAAPVTSMVVKVNNLNTSITDDLSFATNTTAMMNATSNPGIPIVNLFTEETMVFTSKRGSIKSLDNQTKTNNVDLDTVQLKSQPSNPIIPPHISNISMDISLYT